MGAIKAYYHDQIVAGQMAAERKNRRKRIMKKIIALLLIGLIGLIGVAAFGQDTLVTKNGKYLLQDAVWGKDSGFVFSANVVALREFQGDTLREPQGDNRPSCDNGDSPFSIIEVSATANNVQFQFNAANLSEGTWKIGLLGGVFQPTSNRVSIPVKLGAGVYTLEISGNSCNGKAYKKFVVAGIPPPIFEQKIVIKATPVNVFEKVFSLENGRYSAPEFNFSIPESNSKFFLGAVGWRDTKSTPQVGLSGYDYNPMIIEQGDKPWYFRDFVQANFFASGKRAVGPDYAINRESRLFEFDLKFPEFGLPAGKITVMDAETERPTDPMLQRGVSYAKNTTDISKRVVFVSDDWVQRIGCPVPYITPAAEFQKWIRATSAETILESFKYIISRYKDYGYIMLNWEAVMFGVPDEERYKLVNCLNWYSGQNYNAKLTAWMQTGFSISRSMFEGDFRLDNYAGIQDFVGSEAEFRKRYKQLGGQPDYAPYLDVFLIGGYQNFPTNDGIIHHYLLEYLANKKYYPKKLSLASIWHDQEYLAGWKIVKVTPKSANYAFWNKPAAFNQTMYNWGVWTVAVGDGYHLWSNPVQWTDNWKDGVYGGKLFNGQDAPQTPGKMYTCNDMKNVDWLQRGVWEVSQHKDIIDAATKWEYVIDPAVSYGSKLPLTAYKLSADGSEALVLCLNMFAGEGAKDNTIKVANRSYQITTDGTWTAVRRLKL